MIRSGIIHVFYATHMINKLNVLHPVYSNCVHYAYVHTNTLQYHAMPCHAIIIKLPFWKWISIIAVLRAFVWSRYYYRLFHNGASENDSHNIHTKCIIIPTCNLQFLSRPNLISTRMYVLFELMRIWILIRSVSLVGNVALNVYVIFFPSHYNS